MYLRRLSDYQLRQDSVYADQPQQSLPSTSLIVKVLSVVPGTNLDRKVDATLESRDSSFNDDPYLADRELAGYVSVEDKAEILQEYESLLGNFRRPRSVYSQLRDIINPHNTPHTWIAI